MNGSLQNNVNASLSRSVSPTAGAPDMTVRGVITLATLGLGLALGSVFWCVVVLATQRFLAGLFA
jgi:hypothetical protein